MAANYWESTQRRFWTFTKDELAANRQRLEDEDPALVQMFGLPQWRHLNIYFNQQINRLGKRLGVRQQALATAQVYMKRFYTKVEIRRTNPYLVLTTAVYLACKMEECPQHIRMVVQEARSLWPDTTVLHDASKIGECEFFLISEMQSHLIIHQPYRTLTSLQSDFSLSSEEMPLAWSVINDHYMTDLPLLYPPHTIALTAVLLALVLRQSSTPTAQTGQATGANTGGMAAVTAALAQAHAQAQARQSPSGGAGPQGQAAETPALTKDKIERRGKVQRFAAWLAESNIDIEAMVDCTQELVSFYDCQEQYNDKLTREQIVRFMKARNLDK